jgi:hypothetical protein
MQSAVFNETETITFLTFPSVDIGCDALITARLIVCSSEYYKCWHSNLKDMQFDDGILLEQLRERD